MKKSLLLAGAVIFLLGMIQKFDGQEKTQSRRQWPGGGKAVIEQQSKRAHTAFFSRQEPDRWTTDQTLSYQHRMMGHQAYIANATSTLAQHELSAGVDTAWVRHYGSGLLPSHDEATAIAVDDSGNVYVTGTCVSFPTGYGYMTVKYNSSGSQLWVTCSNGSGNSWDEVTALAVDASGNVYVTGTSRDSDTGLDYSTIKYNSEGVEQWVACYNGPANSSDWVSALAVDASGNVYVTGTIISSDTQSDFATVKYNSEGVEQWVACYNGAGNSHEEASALAVDTSGNVYVTGVSYGSFPEADYATVKYNSQGIEQWVARYNGPANSSDWAKSLAVDASGNAYVTGRSSNNYVTVKYTPEGIEQWVARYNGGGDDHATALAVDASGNVYVTGGSRDSDTGSDYATVKYNSEGIEQWVARYNGPGNGYDAASALAVDASGNIYVTGGSGGYFATVKYNSEGVEQWMASCKGPANSSDWATALAVDASGNVYVTGGSEALTTEADYSTVKYNSKGVEQWVARYERAADDHYEVSALAVDASGNVYVLGTSTVYWFYSWAVYTTIKYVQTPVSVEKKEPGNPNCYWLAQNYPNPFNPSTTIEFALPQPAFVTLKVYNLLGEAVATLAEEQRAAGVHKFIWDAKGLASGVYLYRLEAEDVVQTKKLILMR